MSVIEDLPSPHKPISKLWRGEFASTPKTVEELAEIRLSDMHTEFKWRDCFWQPRFEIIKENVVIGQVVDSGNDVETSFKYLTKILLPKRFDPCLCVFDNYNRIWVVMWWPY